MLKEFHGKKVGQKLNETSMLVKNTNTDVQIACEFHPVENIAKINELEPIDNQ